MSTYARWIIWLISYLYSINDSVRQQENFDRTHYKISDSDQNHRRDFNTR